MRKSVLRIFSLCIAVLYCSSCSGNTAVSSSVHTFATENTSLTSVYEETEEIVISSVSETVISASEIPETTTSGTVITKTEEITAETEAVTTETSAETTSVSETTVASSETVSETTVTTTPQTTAVVSEISEIQILSETSVPAANIPPAEIMVSPVGSPAVLVEDTGTAAVDYSNAADGYISASYSGTSARAKLRIVCGDVTCDHDLSVTGEPEYFPLMQGSGDYRIQIYEQYDGKMYMSVLDLSVKLEVADEVKMYLFPNRYSMFDENSSCVRKSAELCGGAGDDIEKIAAIFGFITDNVSYDYDLAATVRSGYIPDPDKVLKVKKGICFDYASLFAAMCRSQGIPTRLVIGYAADDIYHAWNEVYTQETGWITPELLLRNKGYNIVDATFYASAENKEYIADYISDSGNYSSVYRY